MSVTPITSGIIFYSAEAKLNSFIGMTIFKKCLNLELGRRRNSGQLLVLPETFNGLQSYGEGDGKRGVV